jgi:hypothetical protein
MFWDKNLISLRRISGALFVLVLLLSACSAPTTVPTAAPPAATITTATTVPTVTQPAATATPPAPTATMAPPANTPTPLQEQKPGQGSPVTLDVNGVAQSFTSQVIAVVPASAGGPYWEILPQYTVLTLSGYPLTGTLMKPQIFIYPLKDLAAANEGAGQIAASLQALLQNQQVGPNLPFMPLFNAAQLMHAQVSYLDFKNGKGVRFLTQFDQAPLPINNHELIYTYQGLTNDGSYYVAAVLPVNLASLPADGKVTGQEPPEFSSDFPKYLENVVSTLDQQPASAFTPDLSKLDALVQSIEIK